MQNKEVNKIFKVLSNSSRMEILDWLKNPYDEFGQVVSCETIDYMLNNKGGICVGDIVKRSGLVQSTISKYLSDLEDAGLLLSERHGKWTYYRRNEEKIKELSVFINESL